MHLYMHCFFTQIIYNLLNFFFLKIIFISTFSNLLELCIASESCKETPGRSDEDEDNDDCKDSSTIVDQESNFEKIRLVFFHLFIH